MSLTALANVARAFFADAYEIKKNSMVCRGKGCASITLTQECGAVIILHTDNDAFVTHVEIERTTPPKGFNRSAQVEAFEITFDAAANYLELWNENRAAIDRAA